MCPTSEALLYICIQKSSGKGDEAGSIPDQREEWGGGSSGTKPQVVWYVDTVTSLYTVYAFSCSCGCPGNTKVITQLALQTFQEEMGKVLKDPYKVNEKQRLHHKVCAYKENVEWNSQMHTLHG